MRPHKPARALDALPCTAQVIGRPRALVRLNAILKIPVLKKSKIAMSGIPSPRALMKSPVPPLTARGTSLSTPEIKILPRSLMSNSWFTTVSPSSLIQPQQWNVPITSVVSGARISPEYVERSGSSAVVHLFEIREPQGVDIEDNGFPVRGRRCG